MSYLEPSINSMIVAGEGKKKYTSNFFLWNSWNSIFIILKRFRFNDKQTVSRSSIHGDLCWKFFEFRE